MPRGSKKFVSVAIFIGAIVTACLLSEICCSVLLRSRSIHQKTPIDWAKVVKIQPNLLQLQSGYWRASPSSAIRSKMYYMDQLVYEVTYTIDPFGRRITPEKKNAKKFALFLGDSFSFGEGLNDHETLPWQISAQMPDIRTYNYGFSGYGPQDILARIRHVDLKSEVRERKGLVIYGIIGHHMSRMTGSLREMLSPLRARSEAYELDREGHLHDRGSFQNARPLWTFFAQRIARTYTARYFRFEWPTRFSDEQLDLWIAMILETRRSIETQLPGSRFVLFIYPDEDQMMLKLRPRLDRAGIRYLDYSEKRFEDFSPAPRIRDGHPSASFNQAFANRLAADLAAIQWDQ